MGANGVPPGRTYRAWLGADFAPSRVVVLDTSSTSAAPRFNGPKASVLERGLDELCVQLSAELTEREQSLATRAVAAVRADSGGSKPIWVLHANDGERYIFKQCAPNLAAAEETVAELRALARRPVIRAKRFKLNQRGAVLDGVLKRYVDLDASRLLQADTRCWTPMQQTVMLMEHAWEWFVDNLDANPGQYALLGPMALPVNIDWDRAFHTRGRARLSRFAKYRAALPNARTFLYCDYVEGRVELALDELVDEARRIERLPISIVARLLEWYACSRYRGATARRRFVRRVLSRQARVAVECERFAQALLAERHRISTSSGRWVGRIRESQRRLWRISQLAVLRLFRGVVGQAARRALVQLRSR